APRMPGLWTGAGKLVPVRVTLLGPLRVIAADGSAIALGGARVRTLLARLALDAGTVVGIESLIDGLWGETPPADALNALQSLVSRLRRALPAGMIESHPAGYRMQAEVDVPEFVRLAADGAARLRADQPEQALGPLREALRLWHGPALADVADAPFAPPHVTRLTELR